jgi:PAT family beta-lactamase induction signal transducer AmpG
MTKLARLFLDKRMLIAIGMGFASGLPLMLTGSTVQLWYKDAGVDIVTIGLLTMVGLPYSFKFLWSPLLDWVVPPFLGRRRGWLMLTQAGLVAALCGMAMSNPSVSPMMLACFSFLVALISATQDIGIDAYLVEAFPPEAYAMGVQCYVQAYRIAMLVASGGALVLADKVGWRFSYFAMAGFMSLGLLTTFFAPEPTSHGQPKNFVEAVWLPLQEFLTRRNAILLLLFFALYKFGGDLATALTNVFYSDLGYTKTQIGVTAKSFGLGATIGGGMVGATLIYYLGLYRSLWVFGVIQAVCYLSFSWLDHFVHTGGQAAGWALAVAITVENLGAGLATAAYVAFMGSVVDRRFTATQYALLSSLMALPRNLGGPITAFLVKSMGWFPFFFLCSAAAIPGLLLLALLGRRHFRHAPGNPGGVPMAGADAVATAAA